MGRASRAASLYLAKMGHAASKYLAATVHTHNTPVWRAILGMLVALACFAYAVFYWRFPIIIVVIVGAVIAVGSLPFFVPNSLVTRTAKILWSVVIIVAFVGSLAFVLSGNFPSPKALTTGTGGTPPTNSTPLPASTPGPGGYYAETVAGVTHTWSNYVSAGGAEGPTVAVYQTIMVACKVTGFPVADGNPWWYRIASSPWNNAYYASADAFYNSGQTSGSLLGTPWVDPRVPNC